MILVPVKEMSTAKQRLATVLTQEQRTALARDRVWSIYREAPNTLWIGTRGGGLVRMQATPRLPLAPGPTISCANREEFDW